MKQGFALQFSQTLSLTPALQQAIKLLQLSHSELQDELLTQVAENPFLGWHTPPAQTSIGSSGQFIAHDIAHAYLSSTGMQTSPLPPPLDATAGQSSADLAGITIKDTSDASAFEFDRAIDGIATDAASRIGNKETNDSTADSGDYLGWVPAQASTLREYLQAQVRLLRA